MKRLTIEGFNFDINYVASNLQSWPISQCLKKLQAYEDTGLEPEEILKILTNKNNRPIKEAII